MKKVLLSTGYTPDFSLLFLNSVLKDAKFYALDLLVDEDEVDGSNLDSELDEQDLSSLITDSDRGKLFDITEINPAEMDEKERKYHFKSKKSIFVDFTNNKGERKFIDVNRFSFGNDSSDDQINRTDLKAVAIAEKLGKKATIPAGEITVAKLADDDYYRIDNYDGSEFIIRSKSPIEELDINNNWTKVSTKWLAKKERT